MYPVNLVKEENNYSYLYTHYKPTNIKNPKTHVYEY